MPVDDWMFVGTYMTTLNAHLIGRVGNQMFQAAYARSLAERLGIPLRTNPWPGTKIFEGWSEEPWSTDGHRIEDGYRQCQRDLIYTRSDARRWFKLRYDLSEWPRSVVPLAHRRVGDFAEAGHVVISERSYRYHANQINQLLGLQFVTEENPWPDDKLPFPWLADFLRLMHAPVLLRGNSSFSWWAATLGTGEVWSPRIDGLEGGREHDVIFEKGNHCRMFCADGFTDLHLPE